jgi:Family of unknown function (DUF6338)
VRFENVLLSGRPVPGWVFLLPAAYILVPLGLDLILGLAAASRRSRRGVLSTMTTFVVGDQRPPRAWDHVFYAPGSALLVRIRLRGREDTESAAWLGGFFGRASHVSGYGETPMDIYLERAYAMNQRDGSFAGGEDGSLVDLESGLLLRWDEIQFLEVFDMSQ